MFEEIDSIAIECDGQTRRIVLARGDLARIDPAQGVDLLVISAIAGDYTPTPTSLVGQLTAQGIPIQDLALSPAKDLRRTTGAWLSHPVGTAGFKRLVGFEPGLIGTPPDVVGQLFRALFPFLDGAEDQVVAMPLIATGDAGWSRDAILPPLLEAASEWLKLGLPVKTLYIVSRNARTLDDLREHVAHRKACLAREHEAEVARKEGVLIGGLSDVDLHDVMTPAARASSSLPPPRRRRSGTGTSVLALLTVVLVGFAVPMFNVSVPMSVPETIGDGDSLGDMPGSAEHLSAPSNIAAVLLAVLAFLAVAGLAIVFFRKLWRRWGRSQTLASPTLKDAAALALDEAKPVQKRVFLSFSSKDAEAASKIRAALEAAPAPISVFDFRRDIPVGVSYQKEIDAAMKAAHRVICVLTPDYLASPECEEELMVARLRNKREGFKYLWPVYWRGVEGDLEDWIMILNLADCREADGESLTEALDELRVSLAA